MYVYLIYWQHISKLYWKHFDYSAVSHLSWSLIVHIKMHWTLYNYSSDHILYTCQLFLRYKREIFILGVLGFLKTTRSFPKIPEEVRSLPKKSKDLPRRPKSSEDVRSLPKAKLSSPSLSMRINTSSLPVLFTSKIRDHEEGIVIYSFYTWFSFLTWVWVNIFLETVSSKTATTHIFQSGVRNWPASMSRREIEVFNSQVWDSRLRHESW